VEFTGVHWSSLESVGQGKVLVHSGHFVLVFSRLAKGAHCVGSALVRHRMSLRGG